MSRELSLIQNLTIFLLNSVDNIFKFDVDVRGLENLPENTPILFVPNHFTRIETVLIPYVLHKYCGGKFIRSLADKEFFKGNLGVLLNHIGVLSVDDEKRDDVIIGDLITNASDWVIYPEGSMIKNKYVTNGSNFDIKSDYWQGSMRTGSIVLAIKAELLRLQRLSKGDRQISRRPIYVVPVNISYYPLRGENQSVYKIMDEFNLSENFKNEFMLEANLLLNSRISLNIGEGFNINKRIKNWCSFFDRVPLLSQQKKDNFIIQAYSQKLTRKMAVRIYNNLTINIDHLFTFYLYEMGEDRLCVYKMKQFIIRAILFLLKNKKNNLGKKLTKDETLTIFVPKKYVPFEEIVNLAKKLNIFKEDGKDFLVNKQELHKKTGFYDATLKHPFRVIYNEFLAMTKIVNSMRYLLYKNSKNLPQKFTDEIVKFDKDIFYKNYQIYYEKKLSTSYEFGEPFFLKSKKIKVGLVFSHGYLACPQEIREVAQLLNQSDDIAVYGVRLAGHGTSPKNMKDVDWKDWLQSYWNGVAALLNEYDYLFLGGFSTGSLLSLICSFELKDRLAGVFAINPPVNLQDIRSHLVPAVTVWNDVLNAFNLDSLKYEYIENNPIYPETNYKYNYFNGIEQLRKLTKIVKKIAKHICIPTLIINSKNDNIVNPNSSRYLYNNIGSEDKKLHLIDTDSHVIVRGEHQKEVVEVISQFIKDVINK